MTARPPTMRPIEMKSAVWRRPRRLRKSIPAASSAPRQRRRGSRGNAQARRATARTISSAPTSSVVIAPVSAAGGAVLRRREGCEDARVLEGKRVAVVVPAYDEELLLPQTLASIPPFVDRVYVVDDASRDGTSQAARAAAA